MNQKLNLLVVFFFALGMATFTSCQKDDDVIVDPPEVVTCDSLFNVTITMDVDSILQANADGGTAPYSYLWSDGSTESTLEFWSGSPSVTVTDAEGCTAVATFQNSNPNPCSSFVTEITMIGDSAGVTILYANSSGGTAPYTYLWSTGEAGSSINVTASGTYSVTVTDANGCTTEDSIEVNTSDPCANFSTTIFLNNDSMGVNILYANTSGGTAPYAYLWSTGETGSSIEATATGIYSVTVTDANGCTAANSFEVMIVDPCVNFMTTIYFNQDSLGNGIDYLNATLSGGSAPYVFLWSTGETSGAIEVTAPGTYAVTATDANGCVAEDDYEL